MADRPLDAQEGARGDDLVVLDVPEDLIGEYEWVEEGRGYREWLVPAAGAQPLPSGDHGRRR